MKFSKIVIFVGIGCFVGFLFVFGIDLQWGNLSKTENIDLSVNVLKEQMKEQNETYQNRKQVSNFESKRQSNSEKSKDNSDYYQVIVDNSLFRPLGWKPPNKAPEYTLIGTAIDSIGNNSEAFVLESRSNQFYVVSIGEKVGDAVVKGIEKEKVTLDKNGEIITLNTGGMGFLGSGDSSSREGSSSNRNIDENTRNNNRNTRSKSVDRNAERKKMEQMTKEREKKIKIAMKEAQNAAKKMEQAKRKTAIAIEKKKVISYDLKLKMRSEGK